jgi:hypothetical protein
MPKAIPFDSFPKCQMPSVQTPLPFLGIPLYLAALVAQRPPLRLALSRARVMSLGVPQARCAFHSAIDACISRFNLASLSSYSFRISHYLSATTAFTNLYALVYPLPAHDASSQTL